MNGINEMIENILATPAGQFGLYAVLAAGGLYVVVFVASIAAAFTESKDDDAAVEKVMKQFVGMLGGIARFIPGLGQKK